MVRTSPMEGLTAAAILDRLAEAVTVIGPDGRRVHINTAAAAVLDALNVAYDGRPIGAAGRSAVDAAGEPLAPERLPVEVTRLTGAESSDVEFGVPDPDGKLHWLRMSTRRLSDEGPPYTVIASFTVVTAARLLGEELDRERRRHAAVVDVLHEGVLLLDSTGRVLSVNAQCERLLGLSLEELSGHATRDPRWRAIHRDGTPVDPEDLPSRRVLATGEPQLGRLVGVDSGDGVLRWLRVNAVPLQGGVAATFDDVSETLAREQELRQAHELFATAFADAPIGIALVGLDGSFVKVNQALCDLLGHTAEEMLALSFQELTLGDDLEEERALLADVLAGKRRTYQVQKRYRRADGAVIWIQLSVAVVSGDDGPRHFVSHVQDVTDRRDIEERLTRLAERDPLTGLLNRRRFEQELKRQLARLARRDEHAALVMIDLDGFKAVNDRDGHAAGDEVLRSVAAALTERGRESDTLARLGGDEFAALLVGVGDANLDDALAALAAAANLGGSARGVTASVGAARLERDDAPDEVLARADRAMYAAKRAKSA